MRHPHLVLLVIFQTQAMDVDVDGDIVFDLEVPVGSNHYKGFRSQYWKDGERKESEKDGRSKVTVGPRVECMYQYPEQQQINALLSNMMNELTKVFVRAHDLMTEDLRRKHGSRFTVIHKKDTGFFDEIFGNMTLEYLKFYNHTAKRVYRSGHKNPCHHQEKIKQLWKELLDNSLATFRRAAFKCIDGHLKVVNRSADVRSRGKLGELLLKELAIVKERQLDLLCDDFQLCYNELLE